ncbi:YigZ family protein [candidate division SR1 bacterium]|nr:YigZ family protein [candidate division SR1 bacterium]
MPESLTFQIPIKIFTYEIPKIKGSRFIGTLFPAKTRQEADLYIEEMKNKYYDATHHCYAYKLGINAHQDLFSNWITDSKTTKFNDDGEPTNTAGKPILAMLDKYQLHNCLLVITRYFGGTLLGVGGLIQAYGEAASQTIINASIKKQEILSEVSLSYEYTQSSIVSYLIQKYDLKLSAEEYGDSIKQSFGVNKAYLSMILDEAKNLGILGIKVSVI